MEDFVWIFGALNLTKIVNEPNLMPSNLSIQS